MEISKSPPLLNVQIVLISIIPERRVSNSSSNDIN